MPSAFLALGHTNSKSVLWKYIRSQNPGEKSFSSTCSPNLEKLADKIEGETMMSLLENLSTREVASTTGIIALPLHSNQSSHEMVRIKFS
jgi:hypothetical protein